MTKVAQLEKMSDFFAARVVGYDEHMLENVEGCREGYLKMAELIPKDTCTLLDLGCGTGLELDYIYERFPTLRVTGIDLTREMLDVLMKKHGDKSPTLICGDYFKVELEREAFDCAVSFETMHHFKKDKKLSLYTRIYDALKSGGMYIECDYMVESQAEEDLHFAECERLRREGGFDDGEYCHYDTPCTVENQLELFKNAGFSEAVHLFRMGGTSIIAAKK